MARVYIGIGSNIDKHLHIPRVIEELQAEFGEVTVSPVYQTTAVGFEGEDFYNLVVAVNTRQTPREMYRYLRSLEAAHERRRTSGNQFIARTLDLDQLLYDDQQIDDGSLSIPHDDIVRYAFVLKPLADIAPDLIHPVLQKSMRILWQEFDQNAMPMQQLSLADISQADAVKSAR